MSSPPPNPPPDRPDANPGDSIHVNVGEEAQHVAAGKNIIQIGSLSIPRWAALLIVAAVVAVAVLVGFVAYYSQQTGESAQQAAAILAYTPTPTATLTPVPTLTPTPRPFAPAAVGETLLVILPFRNTAANNSEVHVQIWQKVNELLANMPNKSVIAKIDRNAALAAFADDQRVEAENIGKLHNASMVIWGADTGVELVASFLNLREPDFDAADVELRETQRTQMANPSKYAEFVTQDLPGQLAFLALFTVGQTYYLNGDYNSAAHTIENAIEQVPLPGQNGAGGQATKFMKGLADAYFRLGWLYQFPLARLDDALADYNKAIELDPTDAAAYANRGNAYAQKSDFDQALANYNMAIELDPKYALVYNNRGNVYVDMEHLDQALADYNKAIDLDSKSSAAYTNRGLVYADNGEFKKALADYTRAIGLGSEYANAYIGRGIAYTKQGEVNRALADFSRAIELAPNYALTYYNRGQIYSDKGDFVRALADYDMAIKLEPKHVDAYYDRGVVYLDKEDLDRALADFTKAVELDPEFVDAYYNRGLAYDRRGDLDRALADYTKAVELDPTNSKANNNLCWDLALQQQPDKAMPYCEKAVSLSGESGYFDGRGLAHALLGEFPAAIADFQMYMNWLAENSPGDVKLIEQRKSWIESLKRGENPFTPDVLELLNKPQ